MRRVAIMCALALAPLACSKRVEEPPPASKVEPPAKPKVDPFTLPDGGVRLTLEVEVQDLSEVDAGLLAVDASVKTLEAELAALESESKRIASDGDAAAEAGKR